jgi:hypothetical protein
MDGAPRCAALTDKSRQQRRCRFTANRGLVSGRTDGAARRADTARLSAGKRAPSVDEHRHAPGGDHDREPFCAYLRGLEPS